MSGFSDLVGASAESVLTQDLRTRAVTTWSRGWTFYDNLNVLIDFTGATAILTIKDKQGGTTLVTFTQTLTSGRQIVLGNGTVSISATSAGTTGLATTQKYTGIYDLQVTKAGQTVSLVSGKIVIFPPI